MLFCLGERRKAVKHEALLGKASEIKVERRGLSSASRIRVVNVRPTGAALTSGNHSKNEIFPV